MTESTNSTAPASVRQSMVRRRRNRRQQSAALLHLGGIENWSRYSWSAVPHRAGRGGRLCSRLASSRRSGVRDGGCGWSSRLWGPFS